MSVSYTNESRKELSKVIYDTQERSCNDAVINGKAGETNIIRKIGGKEEVRKFLENLGFVTGGEVTVVSEINGNMIVNVKDSRVAIGKDMANKIMV